MLLINFLHKNIIGKLLWMWFFLTKDKEKITPRFAWKIEWIFIFIFIFTEKKDKNKKTELKKNTQLCFQLKISLFNHWNQLKINYDSFEMDYETVHRSVHPLGWGPMLLNLDITNSFEFNLFSVIQCGSNFVFFFCFSHFFLNWSRL